MEFLTSLANSGAELGIDKILIIVFVALVILALLVGYILGRRVTDEEKKKAKKAEKERLKAEKEQEKLDREAAREAEREERRKAKEAKQNKSPKEEIPWVDTENLDSRPSAHGAIPSPKGESGIFIPSKGDDTPAAPVVPRGKKSAPPPKGPAINRAETSAARLSTNIEAKHPAPKPEQKLSRRELKKLEKEKAQAEKLAKAEEEARAREAAKAAKAAEKEAAKAAKGRKGKAAEAAAATAATAAAATATAAAATATATTANAAAPNAAAEQPTGPATPEEMAKRLEAILGTSAGPAVTIGATEEEVPKEEVGKVELSVQPQNNWALDETKLLNEEADKKEAPLPTAETSLPTPEPVIPLPVAEEKPKTVPVVKPKKEERHNEAKATLSYGAGLESSADDVQLSPRQRKKLKAQEEAARKEAEKKAEEEQKKKFSIFAKKKEEEENKEDEFWDENYMGEEIPDSLAGFGFTAAPAVKNEDEKNE
ncbi:MAG: hypothetical protein K5836_04935 [Clostridiales bacterium]|nr:hypothetical protein [Clostridiales bacterium]